MSGSHQARLTLASAFCAGGGRGSSKVQSYGEYVVPPQGEREVKEGCAITPCGLVTGHTVLPHVCSPGPVKTKTGPLGVPSVP